MYKYWIVLFFILSVLSIFDGLRKHNMFDINSYFAFSAGTLAGAIIDYFDFAGIGIQFFAFTLISVLIIYREWYWEINLTGCCLPVGATRDKPTLGQTGTILSQDGTFCSTVHFDGKEKANIVFDAEFNFKRDMLVEIFGPKAWQFVTDDFLPKGERCVVKRIKGQKVMVSRLPRDQAKGPVDSAH